MLWLEERPSKTGVKTPFHLCFGSDVAGMTVCTYFRQIVRSFRVVSQQEPCSNSKDKRRQSLKDKDPSPATLTRNPIHEADTVGEEPAASPSKCSTDKKIADPHRYFAFGVENRQIYGSTRKEAPFNRAEKQTAGDQAPIGLTYTCKSTRHEATIFHLRGGNISYVAIIPQLDIYQHPPKQ